MIRSIRCADAMDKANASDDTVLPPPVGTVKVNRPFSAFRPAARQARRIAHRLRFKSVLASHQGDTYASSFWSRRCGGSYPPRGTGAPFIKASVSK